MNFSLSSDSSALLMVGAFLLDLAIGDPRWLPHPVVLMGKAIAWGEKLLWRGAPRRDFLAGIALTFAVVGLSAGIARAMVLLFSLLPAAWAFMAAVFFASTNIATRGLLIAVARIERPLRDGDIVQARALLSRIVG